MCQGWPKAGLAVLRETDPSSDRLKPESCQDCLNGAKPAREGAQRLGLRGILFSYIKGSPNCARFSSERAGRERLLAETIVQR